MSWNITKREDLDDDAYIATDEIKINRWSTVDRTGGKISDWEFQHKPDAMTLELAEALWDEETIDVTDHGIKLVPNNRNLTDEEFQELQEKYGGEE